MALPGCSCSSGILATALVALLLLPARYYIPEFSLKQQTLDLEPRPSTHGLNPWLLNFPPFDEFLAMLLVLWATITHLCDWIQRKLMERRFLKVNEHLRECLERLRLWDKRQERVEATLRLVQSATGEYNLLAWMLLRRRRLLPSASPNRFFEKDLDDIDFLDELDSRRLNGL
ncbi:unnamed protein product [Leptosia nina]|uniref:Uncharacterized protein n=1 Tax=Leptosia nina TaxID=320188 RepID=A0AAV1JBB6_9NEOP